MRIFIQAAISDDSRRGPEMCNEITLVNYIFFAAERNAAVGELILTIAES